MSVAYSKDKTGKSPIGLAMRCGRAMALVSDVMAYGNTKYTPGTWRIVPPSDFLDAALRHIICIQGGATTDPESGLPHAAHALCNLMYYTDLTERQSHGHTPDWREDTHDNA